MARIDLRLGRWQDALQNVECDALISDPPYGSRCHKGHNHGIATGRREIDYAHWTPEDVAEFVESWAPRTRGWMVAMTSHDLIPAWEAAYEAAGRYAFSPLAWVCPGSRFRLLGDGPSQWSCFIMVARRKGAEFAKWGSLPGAYVTRRRPPPRNGEQRIGGKPLDIMRALVRDYSRPGDLVCDPCAGHGTTLLAATAEGRRGVGAEVDPDIWAIGSGLESPISTSSTARLL